MAPQVNAKTQPLIDAAVSDLCRPKSEDPLVGVWLNVKRDRGDEVVLITQDPTGQPVRVFANGGQYPGPDWSKYNMQFRRIGYDSIGNTHIHLKNGSLKHFMVSWKWTPVLLGPVSWEWHSYANAFKGETVFQFRTMPDGVHELDVRKPHSTSKLLQLQRVAALPPETVTPPEWSPRQNWRRRRSSGGSSDALSFPS